MVLGLVHGQPLRNDVAFGHPSDDAQLPKLLVGQLHGADCLRDLPSESNEP